MKMKFEEKKQRVKHLLENNAFRFGTSAFRLGLIQKGVSDHLPIEVVAKNISLLSWNMLADNHLYNNFMNVSGSDLLLKAVLKSSEFVAGCLYGDENRNQMYHFFAEMSQYLYKMKKANAITIDEKTLKDFIKLENQPSLLARSRDPETAAKKQQQAIKARERFVDILLDESHADAYEFKLAIRHSLEILHHIKDQHGALNWSSRFEVLKENKALVEKLAAVDMLCLQECTNPADIQSLLDASGKSWQMIDYKIRAGSNDHCVIFYDKEKFTLVNEPIYFALEGKKPCIFAKFKENGKEHTFIAGSIHHPGGNSNQLAELIKQAHQLREGSEAKIKVMLLGDFNHTIAGFPNSDASLGNYQLFYPQQGTMSGSDYGNTNKAIDAVLTNMDSQAITVKRVKELSISAPAKSSVIVNFKQGDKIQPNASPSFFYTVNADAPAVVARKAALALGKADIKLAPRSSLTS